MLKSWTLHADYQQFVLSNISSLLPAQKQRLSTYRNSIDKLSALNLDSLYPMLAPYYSNTARPASFQPEIFRSFCLMTDLGETSITNWLNKLRNDDLLWIIIGCTKKDIPSIGSHYAFIDRLWLADIDAEQKKLKHLYPFPKNAKPKYAPGRNKKLPNKHPNVTRSLADFYMNDRSFNIQHQALLQRIFNRLAVVPSIEHGLIENDNLTISGDGTAIHTHSSSYGHKVCDCMDKGIYNCKCKRRYSDPDADIGWDSHLGSWYYGYTLYSLSYTNKALHIDLPLHFRYISAKRHDSVSAMVALAELRQIAPDMPVSNACFDSANDNYPTYELLKHWNIKPFIDLNNKVGAPSKYAGPVSLSNNCRPLCQQGHEMVYAGYSKGRYRHKWRCPDKCGKLKVNPFVKTKFFKF